MKKKIVSKFGGTSMADAECMLRSAKVAIDQKSCLVVVSATSGTTNGLIEITQLSKNGDWELAHEKVLALQDRHLKIGADLKISEETVNILKELFGELESLSRGIFLLRDCSPRALDTVVSLGERLSSALFVEAMRSQVSEKQRVKLLDAREIIKTDDQFGKAKPNIGLIDILCKQQVVEFIAEEGIWVTQGFIGSTEEGLTTTLGRGGSDYSAALFAEGIGADVLEIWTDVAGIATTDPRIYADAKLIDEISFKEASELATFGAKILHPATLLPAMRKNIPTFVGSSFEGGVKGTWVKKEVQAHPLIRAMATRKKQVLLTLSTPAMLHAHGFLFQIFQVLNTHRVSVDAITTSEISVSFTLDDANLLNKKLVADLSQFAEVQVEEGLALVSLIGNNINHTPGLAKRIFEIIPDINVRMICLGASKHNFCFLVDERQADETIRRLHQQLI
ncbi:MAG: lysine-sensitive aspartokinase 3 [Bdellovibrionia bacterium]